MPIRAPADGLSGGSVLHGRFDVFQQSMEGLIGIFTIRENGKRKCNAFIDRTGKNAVWPGGLRAVDGSIYRYFTDNPNFFVLFCPWIIEMRCPPFHQRDRWLAQDIADGVCVKQADPYPICIGSTGAGPYPARETYKQTDQMNSFFGPFSGSTELNLWNYSGGFLFQMGPGMIFTFPVPRRQLVC